MIPISTPDAPQPAGHYAQAIVHAGLVYVSGQLPIDPADPYAAPGAVEAQARRTLANVEHVLRAAGSDLSGVLQLLIYVTEREHWGVVNAVVAEAFGEHRPARAIIPVGPLKRDFALEVTAIATVHQ